MSTQPTNPQPQTAGGQKLAEHFRAIVEKSSQR